jgi:hypothetical protein
MRAWNMMEIAKQREHLQSLNTNGIEKTATNLILGQHFSL